MHTVLDKYIQKCKLTIGIKFYNAKQKQKKTAS